MYIGRKPALFFRGSFQTEWHIGRKPTFFQRILSDWMAYRTETNLFSEDPFRLNGISYGNTFLKGYRTQIIPFWEDPSCSGRYYARQLGQDVRETVQLIFALNSPDSFPKPACIDSQHFYWSYYLELCQLFSGSETGRCAARLPFRHQKLRPFPPQWVNGILSGFSNWSGGRSSSRQLSFRRVYFAIPSIE
jgi:hypothetical protein